MCADDQGKKEGHILWLKYPKKADVGTSLDGQKNFQKKAKKVLTKAGVGGNISERLNEGRQSGPGRSRSKA